MSIDLKAHGLRVKPLEWKCEPFQGWFAEGLCTYCVTHNDISDNWEAFIAVEDDAPQYQTVESAQAHCQTHHELQIATLLEQVEGGQ